MWTHRDTRRSRLGRRARTSTGSAPRGSASGGATTPSDSATSSSSTGRRSPRTARRSGSGSTSSSSTRTAGSSATTRSSRVRRSRHSFVSTNQRGRVACAAVPAPPVHDAVLEVDDASDGPLVPHACRRRCVGTSLMTTVEANGGTLGVEHFGDAAAPLVLLAGGTTMLSWPDALCEALARGGRHVVRYDLRDCGASTTVNPKAPAYTLRDLAADAAALARELDDRPAHLAGIS